MAEAVDNQTTEDTGLSESVDTSTNEEAQDTAATDDLESDDTSFELDAEADETEESDESTDDEAATESEDDETEESTDDVEESESEEDDTASEDVKQRNNEAAQKRIADKQAKEADRQKQYDEYIADAQDDTDRALREVRLEAYIGRIERNAAKIETGLDKAVAAIPELTKGTPEFKEALNDAYNEFLADKVTWDQNGDPIEIKGDVLQYLQAKANSFRKLEQTGARKQEQKKSVQKTKTDVVPTRAPKEAKSDPLLDGFDEEVARLR
jgi:hypothetical protein